MNESALTREVVKLLNATPLVFAVKIHGSPYQRKGLPDISGCCEGAFFGVEMKLKGNKPTEAQLLVLRQIAQAGGLTGVVTVPGTKRGVKEAYHAICEIIGVEGDGWN